MRKLLVIPVICLLAACANIKDTVVPPASDSLRHSLTNKVIYTEGCTYDEAYLKVSHYQGILRVPQPSFFAGFPQSERDEMLRLSVQTAAFVYFQQLQEMGASVLTYTDGTVSEKGSILLKCSIGKIKIGIYDNGFGGFGSAGDFWEAETVFNVSVQKDGGESVLPPSVGKGQIKHAPISPGSFFNLIILSAKIATAAVNGSMFGVTKEGFVSYEVDRNAKSPVEPAARLAAVETARHLAELK